MLEAAVLAHMGCEHPAENHLGADAAQRARDLRGTSLVDLCRAALELEGIERPHGRDGMIRVALSTMSLPVALDDAASKLLLESYGEWPATASFRRESSPFSKSCSPWPLNIGVFQESATSQYKHHYSPSLWRPGE